jgi:hypothetical protein
VGHEHPAVPGISFLAKPSFPYIVPASQVIFLAVGMLVPVTDPARPWRKPRREPVSNEEDDAERLRAERKAKRRAHYLANREQALARTKAYYAANLEKTRASQAAYREANREKLRAHQKAYYAANRERLLVIRAARRAARKQSQ